MRRVRLAEWARQEGISRITAYRMLQRGILPVPFERSPTGRWYVLLPAKRIGRIAMYARGNLGSTGSPADEINEQISSLSDWATNRRLNVYTVVREIADLRHGTLPRFELLLADEQITHILIDSPDVLGICLYRVVVAALSPQGRSVIVARTDGRTAVGGQA